MSKRKNKRSISWTKYNFDNTQTRKSPQISSFSRPMRLRRVCRNRKSGGSSYVPSGSVLKEQGQVASKVLQALQDLDVEDLILTILDNRQKIKYLANSKYLKHTELLAITKILSVVCKSPYAETKCTILPIFLNYEFVTNFQKSIGDFQTHYIPGSFSRKAIEYLSHLKEISNHIPISVEESIVKILQVVLDILKTNISCFENTHSMQIWGPIKDQIEDIAHQLLINQKETVKDLSDNFRHVPIYPSASEVLTQNFFRPNVLEPYHNVNHYLDAQFRSLREDFLRRLRIELKTYLSRDERTRNFQIYEKVRFVKMEVRNEQFCFRLQLYPGKNEIPNFANTFRLMYGALLCFTINNFATTFFGKICDSNLEKGEIIVEFEKNISIVFDQRYTMVECKIYFEPYFQVLKALQSISQNDFPLEKYIIKLDLDSQPPKYLTGDDCKYTINGQKLFPLQNWPVEISESLGLNEAQLSVFKAALTREFSIIHGGPGTGKTYLGFAVTKTLLENKHLWYNRTPILFLSYTNRALDQFLEGVLKYTKKIIRVGGCSENENLQQFSLKSFDRMENSYISEKERHLQEISSKMKKISIILEEIGQFRGIIAFNEFEEVVPQTWFYHASKNAIAEWLLAGSESMNMSNYNDLFESHSMGCKDFLIITLESINNNITTLLQTVKDKIRKRKTPKKFTYEKISDLNKKYRYLLRELRIARQDIDTRLEKPKTTDLVNPKNMNYKDRWRLYLYWLKMYKKHLFKALDTLNSEFQSAYKEYNEVRILESVKLLRKAFVVGMTTTNAARLRPALQTLKSPIVIVEESGEMLEAHIAACLTVNCQQLILIGDYQQLPLKTSYSEIESKFSSGVSLLERMVINTNPDQYSGTVLKTQYRMRPEIATLLSPVCPLLDNHSSVTAREPIRGLDKCLFFIDRPNTSNGSNEILFLIHLAKYLILNGYASNNITILTAYRRQFFEFQQEIVNHEDLKNVRISVLKDFQGKECDIILLLIVRNNNEKKSEFLSVMNKIGITLSRAKNGFLIVGNLKQLCNDNDSWIKIGNTLLSQGCLGSKLPLRCQVHPDVITYVESGPGFIAIPNGGCTKKCKKILKCGHQCNFVCHTQDIDHKNYRCEKQCNRLLCDQNHKCEKICYETCGPCNFLIQKNLMCGHQVEMKCHVKIENYRCPVLIPFVLLCSHTVEKPCHQKPKDITCPHSCDKILACGHTCGLKCHNLRDPYHLKYKCKKRCNQFMKGCSTKEETHKCRKLCYEDCDRCIIPVKKERAVCFHFHEVPCDQNVDEVKCNEPYSKTS